MGGRGKEMEEAKGNNDSNFDQIRKKQIVYEEVKDTIDEETIRKGYEGDE